LDGEVSGSRFVEGFLSGGLDIGVRGHGLDLTALDSVRVRLSSRNTGASPVSFGRSLRILLAFEMEALGGRG